MAVDAMTDSTVIEEQSHDVTAPEPASTPAPADDLDSLLREFDERTAQQPEPEPATIDNAGQEGHEIDALLAEFSAASADQRRVSELEGELNSARVAELQRQSRQDFEGFAKKLQAELGPNVPDDYARTTLLAMSAENPALAEAWRFRHVTADQRRAAELEFQQLEVLHWRAQQAPDDPRKAEALAQIERRGQELGLMMNAGKILDRAWRDVQRRAEKARPPIDIAATEDRELVAQSIRDAGSGRAVPAEPPPNLGRMSDSEFRKYTLENFGF
jgi:hypothetical protein